MVRSAYKLQKIVARTSRAISFTPPIVNRHEGHLEMPPTVKSRPGPKLAVDFAAQSRADVRLFTLHYDKFQR